MEVIDARGNTAEEREYGMAGQALLVDSEDAGERRSLADVVGNPLRGFDERGFVRRFEYDALLRPTHAWVTPSGGTEFLVMRTAYGELVTSPQTLNLRGRAYRTYDGAGVSDERRVRLQGNVLTTTRQLALTYTTTPDWTALAAQTTIAGWPRRRRARWRRGRLSSRRPYDGLNRPLTQTTPDSSEVQLTYNDAGLLDAVDARVRGAGTATAFIDNIDYDVRGRRERIEYSNGTVTTYAYDEVTQRLTDLRTTRTSDSAVMQDLHYTYDPVGNITEIEDAAQQTVYFQNAVVSPDQRFEYDALYRLRRAEGREHTSLSQPTDSDLAFGAQPHPDDPSALRTYAQEYVFDVVGNLLQMQHTATGGNFTRQYTYAAGGNRLLSNSAPGESTAPFSHTYSYDVHGNMTSMPHLAAMDWTTPIDCSTATLAVAATCNFLYDAGGTRVAEGAGERVGVAGDRARLYRAVRGVPGAGGVSGCVAGRGPAAADAAHQRRHRSALHGRDEDDRVRVGGGQPGGCVSVSVREPSGDGSARAGWVRGGDLVRGVSSVWDDELRGGRLGDRGQREAVPLHRQGAGRGDRAVPLRRAVFGGVVGEVDGGGSDRAWDGVKPVCVLGGKPNLIQGHRWEQKAARYGRDFSPTAAPVGARKRSMPSCLDVNARLGRLDALERGVKNFKRDVGARRARLQGAEKEVARAKSGVQRNAFVLSRRGAAESKRATPLSGQDVRDFAERVGRAVEETGRAIGRNHARPGRAPCW